MALYLGNLELATGGGSTGTGLPVNSYKSFSVGGATNNPSGYNITTGLYSHPNGDYWLKTGKTLPSSDASTYPNATLNFVSTPTGTVSSGGALDVLQAVGYTPYAASQGFGPVAGVRSGASYQGYVYMTSTWTYNGYSSFNNTNPPMTSISQGPGSTQLYVNPSNQGGSGGVGIMFSTPYNNQALMTSLVGNIPAGTAKGASWDSNSGDYYFTNTAGTIYRYNSSYTLLSTTVTGISGGAIATNATNIYLGASSGTVVTEFTIGSSITATGKTFDPGSLSGGTITSVDALDIYNGKLVVTDSSTSVAVEFTEPASVLGNGTAYTDAVTGDPIFIKLK